MLDILIRDGDVVDGSGAPRFRADVAVEGDRIVEVGSLAGTQAGTVIDASGCVVAPGFVDMHSHAGFSLPVCPTADSLACQGITTAVIGQCGFSTAPLLDETRDTMLAALGTGAIPMPWDEWSTFGEYLDYLARIGTSINVVPLVGQGSVRVRVMGLTAEPASEAQIGRMQAQVIQAMEEGAVGLSTGLIYPPGSYTSTEELVDVTRPVGEQKGFYFSHLRDEGDRLLEAVSEAIGIGRESGAAVQISHFKAAGRHNWDKASRALDLIDQARAEGLDVSADMYPYVAGSTYLAAVLPQWAHEGGKRATLQRLGDPQTRQRMAADMQSAGFFRIIEWDQVMISGAPRNRAYQGRYVADLAAGADKSPYDWVFDALLELELEASMITFMMSEDNVRRALQHPATMIGTDGFGFSVDGPLAQGAPHPRSYGTYPRVLGRYVREQGVLSLEEAMWKMTGFPAQKLRWADRGLVKQGLKADLVVLDPDTVADRATFQAPHQYPAGIQHVIVNGRLVVSEGRHTKTRPGRVLGA